LSAEVGSAHHLGDGHKGVVDHAGELITGRAGLAWSEWPAPDQEVAEVATGDIGLRPEATVTELNGLAVRHAKAVAGVGIEAAHRAGGWAAAAAVDGLIVVLVRGLGALGEVVAAAGARIDGPGGEQAVEGFAVGVETRGLGEHGRLPLDAEPGKILQHGVDELRLRALGIEVLVAQQQLPAGGPGALVGDPEGCRVAEMQQPGGRGSKPSNVVCSGNVHESL